MRGRTLAVAAPVVALALAIGFFLLRTRQLAGVLGVEAFPLDDSWIHMQFARNLAEGRGFSYNPGVPVSGSTAPLWTLALGGAFAVFGSHPVLAKALGIAATLGTAWLAGPPRPDLGRASRRRHPRLRARGAGRADGVGRALRHGGRAGRRCW